jgi:hypothetical protein
MQDTRQRQVIIMHDQISSSSSTAAAPEVFAFIKG